MRLDVRIRKVEKKINTTQFELLGESPPMESFYVNTETVTSLPFDTGEMVLTISSEPFADGEVALAFPPVPFFKAFRRVVRYEYRIERRGKERRVSNTPDTPVNLAYVNKEVLEDEFIAEQKPIYFGISAVTKAVIEDEKQAAAGDVADDEKQAAAGDVADDDEIDRADAIAAFDAFLRESVRFQRGGKLTSRQILAVWRVRWDADLDDEVIRGIQLADVARRFRVVFGVTMLKDPTRIDGDSQRYWNGFTI